MPVARSRISARSAIVVGGAGVVTAVVLLLFVIWAAGQSGDRGQISLGDDKFKNINAARMAKSIANDGPVLFPDASGNRSRDIYVQHLGPDPKTGWLVFDAHQPGASRDCYLQWQADRRIFVDRCDGAEYPEDGGGLPHYPATVNDKGTLVVDFNPAPSTTAAR